MKSSSIRDKLFFEKRKIGKLENAVLIVVNGATISPVSNASVVFALFSGPCTSNASVYSIE